MAEKKAMVMFFVVDTSGSMDGSKIGALNMAIEEVILEIRKIFDVRADVAVKIAVLDFSSEVRWITPMPIDANDFVWSYPEALTKMIRFVSVTSSQIGSKTGGYEVNGSAAESRQEDMINAIKDTVQDDFFDDENLEW